MEPKVWYMRLVGGRGWGELGICLPVISKPRAANNIQVIIKVYSTVFFCDLCQFTLTGFIEWRWPGFGRGGAAVMASVRRSQGLAPGWTQPIPDRSSWLRSKPNRGYSWAQSCLCESIFKKGKKMLEGVTRREDEEGVKRSEKQQKEHQGERWRRRRCSMAEQIFLKELLPMEDRQWSRGKEKEGVMEINHYGLTTAPLPPLLPHWRDGV